MTGWETQDFVRSWAELQPVAGSGLEVPIVEYSAAVY